MKCSYNCGFILISFVGGQRPGKKLRGKKNFFSFGGLLLKGVFLGLFRGAAHNLIPNGPFMIKIQVVHNFVSKNFGDTPKKMVRLLNIKKFIIYFWPTRRPSRGR